MYPSSKNKISIISKHIIKSSPTKTLERIHLTPFDLSSIKIKYINYGLLYRKPTNFAITNLLSSFSKTLNLFYPLAGRLVTTNHDDNTISISLDCTNQGAEFIHASAPAISIHSSELSDLFPLKDLTCMHGRECSLLSVQYTELSDGVFIACSFNHVVADGTSAWHFINTWASLSRSENEEMAVNLPVFKRWFIESCHLPIRLPRNFMENVDTSSSMAVNESHIFSFSKESVATLKARANEEAKLIGLDKQVRISSLQCVLAHAWKAITRARALKPEERTTLVAIVGYRTRKIEPAVPEHYFGNINCGVGIRASAKELKEKSLGWASLSLNKAINSHGEEDVYRWVESWCEKPGTHGGSDPEMNNMVILGESNRFDIYGNDFGWGKPVAFRYGWGNMNHGGFVKIVTGKEEGSIDLHVVLRVKVMSALLEDEEFLAMVG